MQKAAIGLLMIILPLSIQMRSFIIGIKNVCFCQTLTVTQQMAAKRKRVRYQDVEKRAATIRKLLFTTANAAQWRWSRALPECPNHEL